MNCSWAMCALCDICFFVFLGVDNHLILVFTPFSKSLSLIHLHILQQNWKSLHTAWHLILSVTLLEASWVLCIPSKLVGFHLLHSCCPRTSLYHRPGDSLCLSATAFPVYWISRVLCSKQLRKGTWVRSGGDCPLRKVCAFHLILLLSMWESLLASTDPDLLYLH